MQLYTIYYIITNLLLCHLLYTSHCDICGTEYYIETKHFSTNKHRKCIGIKFSYQALNVWV